MDSTNGEVELILNAFLKKLNDAADTITFDETMAVIDAAYTYTPVAFVNGDVRNDAGQNAGSCKLLAFGLLNELSERQTLACFGLYYREDVLKNPAGTDHQNIRNFMKTGWAGVRFAHLPLQPK